MGALDKRNLYNSIALAGMTMMANNQSRPYMQGPNNAGSLMGQGGQAGMLNYQRQNQIAMRQAEAAKRSTSQDNYRKSITDHYSAQEKMAERKQDWTEKNPKTATQKFITQYGNGDTWQSIFDADGKAHEVPGTRHKEYKPGQEKTPGRGHSASPASDKMKEDARTVIVDLHGVGIDDITDIQVLNVTNHAKQLQEDAEDDGGRLDWGDALRQAVSQMDIYADEENTGFDWGEYGGNLMDTMGEYADSAMDFFGGSDKQPKEGDTIERDGVTYKWSDMKNRYVEI